MAAARVEASPERGEWYEGCGGLRSKRRRPWQLQHLTTYGLVERHEPTLLCGAVGTG